ncbi:(d)CMP kinase [bacterium]|nr:(d)CMP kinase [candidate division CSSED10-310 bacterium]
MKDSISGKKLLDVVTIDGPGGSGKSTVAREVAVRLGYTFLDTGAMYRAVAYAAMRSGLPVVESRVLAQLLKTLDIRMMYAKKGMSIFIGQEDVTTRIRQPDISRLSSDFSTLKSVRAFCAKRQRRIGIAGNVVAEGRDMGTVVFPDARWKFFLTADPRERAERRWREDRERGIKSNLNDVYRNLVGRDHQDAHRSISPLQPAPDAQLIDTTHLSVSQVVEFIIGDIRTDQEKIFFENA